MGGADVTLDEERYQNPAGRDAQGLLLESFGIVSLYGEASALA